MDKKAQKRAKEIIDAQLNENLEPRLARVIRAWFIGSANQQEKFSAMEELWNKHITESYESNAELDADFEQISRRLGFPEIKYAKPRIALRSRRVVTLRHRMLFRIAAVLLPFLMIAGAAYLWIDGARNATEQHQVAEMMVSAGSERKTVTLSDGSQVTLYPGAELKYPEAFNSVRSAHLSGKAYFRIAKDDSREFTVVADGMNITVHGTEFMVTAFEGAESCSVTLHSGSVDVEAGDYKTMLEPCQRLQYYSSTGEVTVAVVELEDWTKPNLEFYLRPLGEICDALEEYYGVVVDEGDNPEILNTRYTIDLAGFDQIETALRLVQGVARDIQFEKEQDTIKIRTRK